MAKNFDLFGNPIEESVILREEFIEPPFTILDAKGGGWQKRKNMWKSLGIKSEVGRDAKAMNMKDWADKKAEEGTLKGRQLPSDTSIFDPALCEVLYRWFCEKGDKILDPFAGGSVRGIVANYLGYNYTGIDIREEQIKSNYEQAEKIIPDNMPQWFCGDSNKVLDELPKDRLYDFVFSCPPYGDLEVYSDLDGDISNMPYDKFLRAYREIIAKCCERLKSGGFACFVVGEFRDKHGNYVGFVPDTIKAFTDAGLKYYNEAILCTCPSSASIRAKGNMKTKKLVKVHQNVLVFKKD